MYEFATHTWNAIKGKCPHDCCYCYMKRFPQGELRLDEKELKTDLGKGNFIFVGSSVDMWAKGVKYRWIRKVLEHCQKFSGYNTKFLFQSKDPKRFERWRNLIPDQSFLATTIETNRDYKISNAPSPEKRYEAMVWFVPVTPLYKMVSIEPIIDFDLDILVKWIKMIDPAFVSIGADSKGHNLPEPSWFKVQQLIKELEKFTRVKIKKNLGRLIRHQIILDERKRK